MKYVLGAGIAGLTWAYYHPEYAVVSDRVGWAVAGADPLVLLHDGYGMRRFISDLLGVDDAPVTEKLTGYIVDDDPSRYPRVDDSSRLTDEALDTLLTKKLIPWNVLSGARRSGVEVEVKAPSRVIAERTEAIRYVDVDSRDVVGALLDAVTVRNEMIVGERVVDISANEFRLEGGRWYKFDHAVSTLPAPVFAKIWRHNGTGVFPWEPTLNYLPLTFVVSEKKPDWLTDRWSVVYDARRRSPLARIGLLGGRVQYEVTGRLNQDDEKLWLRSLAPMDEGVFTFPYGRIIQDVQRLTSPYKSISFLGRFAEWKYEVLLNHVLDRAQEGVG